MTARRKVVVDTETTGLNTAADIAVEVAWWDLTTGERDRFIPPHPGFDMSLVDPKALELNGYYARGLDNPNRWDWTREGLRRLHAAVSGQTLVGSNPRFDAAMLARPFEDDALSAEPWHHRLRDLASYAAGVLDLDDDPGLAGVCAELGIPAGDHTAEGDVTATGHAILELQQLRRRMVLLPAGALVIDPTSDEAAEAMARAAMRLPAGRLVRPDDRAYGRRVLAELASAVTA